MQKSFPSEAVTYTEEKTTFLEGRTEQWFKDHCEVEECVVWEGLARDVNRLFTDIIDLDSELQESYCNGLPYQKELEERIHNLVVRWVALAGRMLVRGAEFERKGFEVECLDELRRNDVEAKATLDPSQELSVAMATLRDQQMTEHEAGKSHAGFAG